MDVERAREEALLPQPPKTHEGTDPLDLPVTAAPPGAAPVDAKPAAPGVRVER